MNLTIFCFQNFTLRSTRPQSGPASSLSAVNEDLVSIKLSSLFRGETDIVQHCLNRFFEEISFLCRMIQVPRYLHLVFYQLLANDDNYSKHGIYKFI